MKVIENFFTVCALFVLLVALTSAHSSEEKAEYECRNIFYRYYLDNEPAEYGLSAGQYAPGKKAYIGLSVFSDLSSYLIGQLQLNPPGIKGYDAVGPAWFSNDTKKIWYLYKNPNHHYEWVNSENSEIPPFAIDVGEYQFGISILIGRIKLSNGFVAIGSVITAANLMFYVDENGMTKNTDLGFQILTCKSTIKNETKTPISYFEFPSNKDSDTGCIHNWRPYKNDEAPAINGIAAGDYDCNNTIYVGKAKDSNFTFPGPIQIYPQTDNPNYTYYWTPFDGSNLPNNIVYARNDVGILKYGVGRIKINGHTQIGKIVYPALVVANNYGIELPYSDYEILVCDPWPKYKFDGFSVDSTSFIGRSTRKCINGCDYGLGKIQAGSNGVNYLDDLTANAIFDNSSNAEYLVKNLSYTYKWQPSRNGVKVANALELHKEGHRPFYIGMIRITDNFIVGKVRPDEGLFFIDPFTGKQQSTSSYEVLTCTSPDASNGEYEENSDADWFEPFGCPVRKQWSFTKWRCVCRDEFKGVFASSGAKWNEETCSYV